MKRGPKPLPKAVATARNSRRRAERRHSIAPLGRLAPPDRLSASERDAWHELTTTLAPLRVLSTTEQPRGELLVRTWVTWQQAEQLLHKSGPTFVTDTGYVGQRPEVAIALKQKQLLRQLLNEIGATPASRSSIEALPPDTPTTSLTAFIAARRT